MPDLTLFLWCVLGVIISVVLPPILQYVRKAFSKIELAVDGRQIWEDFKPYVLLGVASVFVSIILFAAIGDTITDWKTALLAGYLFDSTLQKIRG